MTRSELGCKITFAFPAAEARKRREQAWKDHAPRAMSEILLVASTGYLDMGDMQDALDAIRDLSADVIAKVKAASETEGK